jgi:hypothetical protein
VPLREIKSVDHEDGGLGRSLHEGQQDRAGASASHLAV